jgi:FKBP-type peptidyl-prolyl cis-trans isomerase
MGRTLMFAALVATTAGAAAAPVPKTPAPVRDGKMPPLDAKEWRTLPNGLKVWEVKRGGGDMEVVKGDTVVVRYTGWLTDGTVFDTNKDAEKPASLPLNALIPGWQQGLDRMKVGGVRRLVVPPELGYGNQGAPPKIPPKAALVFEIELIETDGP